MTESTYRFLDYELNVTARQLMRKNTVVKVRPKTLATLAFLLANRSEIVTKEEILESTWPNADVQDQAVFQSISELRSLFKGHNCIETVHGSGYRWALPLKPRDGLQAHPVMRWPEALAACLVVLVGSVSWWQMAGDTRSFSVNVHPAEFVTEPTSSSKINSSSVDHMLIQQLRRMGWDTQPVRGSVRTVDQVDISIHMDLAEAGTTLFFQLRGHLIEQSGHITSATPLGAIRDLTAELHDTLSLIAEDDSAEIRVSQLFAKAKAHLDREEYPLAEAYLTVALTELPNQKTLQRALAYAYKQMGRYDDALSFAYKAHDAANQKNTRTDRMMSSILLSKLLLKKGNFEDSNKFAYEALDLATNINDLLIVAEAQEQLGEISLLRGNVSTGREQLTVALKYFRTFCPTGESRVSRRLHELES